MHFTVDDLTRVQVASAPDPIWETTLALHQLTGVADVAAGFSDWRRRSRSLIEERRLGWPVKLLATMASSTGYYPDFLTPPEGSYGLEAGLEAMRATPPARVRQEVRRLAANTPPPRSVRPWVRGLAAGDRNRMAELTDVLKAVHDVLVTPVMDEAQATVEADLARRRDAMSEGGVHGLLASFSPLMRWQSPVLHINYSVDRDVHLAGRGLRLVPSYFGVRTPLTLADPRLGPILVYPVSRRNLPLTSREVPPALPALLGRTRARVLTAVRDTTTTGELASGLQIAPASASEHVHVLLAAGLVRSHRAGNQMLHTLTPLGSAVLRGLAPASAALI